MGLSQDFPRQPYEIIKPDVRWFPGRHELGEKGREKLLPPLAQVL
mgnify:CR=1 FL=1